MLFRPLDVGSSALLRSLPCPSIALAQTRALCVVSTHQMSSVTCDLGEASPKKIDGRENATPDDRVRGDSVDILVIIGVGISICRPGSLAVVGWQYPRAP